QANSLHVTDKKAISGHNAEHAGFGILVFKFRRNDLLNALWSAAGPDDSNIADTNVFDLMPGNSTDYARILRGTVLSDDVGNIDVANRADRGFVSRNAATIAKTYENRQAADLAHRDIADADVVDNRAIHRFQCQALATIKDTVRNGDILESSIGFCAKLDA